MSQAMKKPETTVLETQPMTREEAGKRLLALHGVCSHKHISDKQIQEMEITAIRKLMKERGL